MRTRLVDIGLLALAALSLGACTDDHKDLLAPRSPEKLVVSPIPVYLNPLDFLQIAAGSSYTCAMQRDGDVWCWGMYAKAPSVLFQGATQIAVGDSHACALNKAGAAFCWGMDTEGQVGWETAFDETFEPVKAVAGPVDKNNPYGPLLPPLTFTSIAAGGNSSCGTNSTGVFCWGQGVFPDVHNPASGVPSLITTPSGSAYGGFWSLAVGSRHACGFLGGQVNCWGLNAQFQTGVDPSWTFDFLTWPISGTLSNIVAFMGANYLGSSVARVSAQGALTCADMLNKTVECFGNNDNGQLGNGPGASTYMPQVIGGSMSLHGVAAGALHACALDANNLAQCWGSDARGELGNGQPVGTFTTVQKVAVESIDMVNHIFGTSPIVFRSLASGAEHTCGIGTDNHIYCWGDNQARQLGRDVVDVNGNPANFTVNPVKTM